MRYPKNTPQGILKNLTVPPRENYLVFAIPPRGKKGAKWHETTEKRLPNGRHGRSGLPYSQERWQKFTPIAESEI
jgi:hypothetical protein